MEKNCHEVIIIGAGASGIGASRVLTERGVPHLILESRNRIGGRVHAWDFNGAKLELGARFVHSPQYSRNYMARFVEQNDWPTHSFQSQSTCLYYENKG
jgi:cation diffusion facilitator CzcD-associated flavoprotein CzcO